MEEETSNDPIVLYLIVRESLNMSGGKVAAQVGHGVQNLLLHYFKAQVLQVKLHKDLPEIEAHHVKITTDWLAQFSRKVVLRADEKEWVKLKSEFKDCIVIKDCGLTEVIPGSETVIGLWPMHKSERTATIKRLRVL